MASQIIQNPAKRVGQYELRQMPVGHHGAVGLDPEKTGEFVVVDSELIPSIQAVPKG